MAGIILLIRHGQSLENLAYEAAINGDEVLFGELQRIGPANVPLTFFGEAQANILGRFLAGKFRLTKCFSSPYLRARETAKIALSNYHEVTGTPVEIIVNPRLREKNFGVVYGTPPSKLKEMYPRLNVLENSFSSYYFRPKNGESGANVRTRVNPFCIDIAHKYFEEDILISGHKHTNSIIHLEFTGVKPRIYNGMVDLIGECSILQYQLDPKWLKYRFVGLYNLNRKTSSYEFMNADKFRQTVFESVLTQRSKIKR